MEKTLYHITAWENIPKEVGAEFILVPGPQCAEGTGVFFSEGKPRPEAADGTYMGSCSALVQITASGREGWWKTKNSICRKFGRPRTYHSRGKSIKCRILDRQGWGKLICSWEWE